MRNPKELRHRRTLLFYDIPQVFIAVDAIGTLYICALAEEAVGKTKYICIPSSETRVVKFEKGEIDLLSIIQFPELPDVFCAVLSFIDEQGALVFSAEPIAEIPESWLPAEGLVVHYRQSNEDEVLSEAKSQNRSIAYLSLEPPESRKDNVIGIDNLVESLTAFQKFIEQAYRKALRELPDLRRANQQLIWREKYDLEAYGFLPGSFIVKLRSGEPADLLGKSDISVAFERIDRITAHTDQPEATMKELKNNKGRLASAFQQLLKFSSESNATIKYTWASPESNVSHKRTIEAKDARMLYKLMCEQSELSIEECTFIGVFTGANSVNGTWQLKIEDGKSTSKVAGKTEKDKQHILDGVTIETIVYRLQCYEKLEETTGTGRHKYTLILRSFEPLKE